MAHVPTRVEQWLAQAADAKAVAEKLTDPRSRRTMMVIARGYEKLAEHAARTEREALQTVRAVRANIASG